MTAKDEASPTAKRVCLVCNGEYSSDQARCPRDGTVLVILTADPYTGKTLGERYAIVGLIGTGGTSVVYKAQHLQLERLVAIKMLKAHLVTDDESKKRFEQEARAVSCLTHPHVITVYDVGVTKYGEPYIVMEYLEGLSLAALIAKEGPIPYQRGIKMFNQACAALAHAHRKEVIHRDVKPSNIMLVPTDEDPESVKIVDFGLAKLRSLTGEFQRLTKTGDIFGSPVYMSPEQCTGRKLDQRTDVYSMGVVMYESLTGRPPFRERTSIDTIRKQIKDPPPPFAEVLPDVHIPSRLEQIVMTCLDKNPDERYQTMEQLRNQLEAFNGAPLSLATPVVAFETLTPEVRGQISRQSTALSPAPPPPAGRSKLAIVVSAVVGLLLLAIILKMFVLR